MQMDNEFALKLVKHGGTFIFLNVPVGLQFGIDMKTWTTGEKFKGVKMIPPGPHFIYYNLKDKYGNEAHRSGFFHYFHASEVHVKKWDVEAEDISTEEMGDFQCNLLEFDQFLGPYPFEILDKWTSLSKHISEKVIEKLTPECKLIRSAMDLIPVEKKENFGTKKRWSKGKTEEERQEDLLPELVPVSEMRIRFTEMPDRRYPKGASPSQITLHYLDNTYALNKMLSTCSSPVEFIGEIQFAFICFLLGLNLGALEQWKKLIQLLCCCEKAIVRYTNMYSELISCLEAHLKEIPQDFLVDIVANNNVIYKSLREFFATLGSLKNEVEGSLFCKAERFKEKLTTKFGWDFTNLEEEDDDEAPVVVEL